MWEDAVGGSEVTAADPLHDPAVWMITVFAAGRISVSATDYLTKAYGSALICLTNGICGNISQEGPADQPSLWPSSWYGRQAVNVINYSIHALDQMSPVGMGGRGVPPSAVENALNFGVQTAGRFQNTVVYTFENVVVVWNYVEQVVVTVIKTGH